jgi:hypothetical protein
MRRELRVNFEKVFFFLLLHSNQNSIMWKINEGMK